MRFSRRNFFSLAAAAAAGSRGVLSAQPPAQAPPQKQAPNLEPWTSQPQPYPYYATRSTVAIAKGDNRRKLVEDALVAIDDQIRPVLKTKKYVLIKPNCVSAVPLGTTNPDALMGVIDYLAPRFKGPIVIGEASGNTLGNFDALGYKKVISEYPRRSVTLVDFNREAKYQIVAVLDYNAHVIPVRLAARMFDTDAYIISCSVMKTHNAAVATMAVKNMVLGGPLSSPPGETPRWSDKRKFHVGVRMMQVNMMLTAQKLRPCWGAAVIDGYEGMEGNGPHAGTPVPHRIAIASTDYIAADRTGLEAMGIDPEWVGYLLFSYQIGLGQYDLNKIDIRGQKLADVKRKYLLHPDIDLQKRWMGPMEELPPRLG